MLTPAFRAIVLRGGLEEFQMSISGSVTAVAPALESSLSHPIFTFAAMVFPAAVEECDPLDAGNYGKQAHITVRPYMGRKT